VTAFGGLRIADYGLRIFTFSLPHLPHFQISKLINKSACPAKCKKPNVLGFLLNFAGQADLFIVRPVLQEKTELINDATVTFLTSSFTASFFRFIDD
jgi:hypothetical protein